MKFIVLVVTSFIVLFTGCANKQNTISNNENDKKFERYNNTNHIVGNPLSSITTLVYAKESNGKIVDKITFYIDKFPYEVHFNLCEDMKSYKDFDTVFIDEKAKEKTPQYFQNSINCQSTLNMTLYKNDLHAGINFNLFQGFKIVDVTGVDKKLPVMTPFRVSPAYGLEKTYDKQIISQDFINKEITYFQLLKY